jgi:hypothetical protein
MKEWLSLFDELTGDPTKVVAEIKRLENRCRSLELALNTIILHSSEKNIRLVANNALIEAEKERKG